MRRFLAILFIPWLLAAPTQAEEAASPEFASDAPIEITSHRLKAQSDPRLVTFIGEVVARQDDLVIYADRLQVLFGGEDEQIDTLEATGTVRIVQGDNIATGEKAVYQRRVGIVTLSGAPRVRQGMDFVEGDEVIVYLDEGRSEVIGAENSRVKAVIHPREEKP